MDINRVIALLLASFLGLWANVYAFFNNFINDYVFSIDTSVLGEALPNVKSNLNRFGGRFPENPVINEEYNPYEFIEYIQLMECSGGNSRRDLFIDPNDFSVTDDYNFEPLLSSCRGILKTGAKPLLKLGNVPAKLSRNALAAAGEDLGAFAVNIYPPDDYNEYYAYIKAIAEALVEEFGISEVRSWRFGVMTEYENVDWFRAVSGDPDETAEAYCKLYDFTVQALLDVLGPDVFVGAHSMTCSEGLWDEALFIRHCAEGTNYATGKKGTRLCYLAASYYENSPGNEGSRLTVPEIIRYFRSTAESVGLTDLIFGVDEGRILLGTKSGAVSSELNSRTVGYTYQAAFDARLIKQMFDSGMDYFSSWEYCSESENHGLPIITYFVAKHASDFKGAHLADVKTSWKGHIIKADVNASAAFNESAGTLHVMAYNYRNSLDYKASAQLKFKVKAPQLSDGEAKVTAYMIDDDCNWFDEWQKDRADLGITDDMFSWSPDDGCPTWHNDDACRTFLSLADKYSQYCRLEPAESVVTVKNGEFTLSADLAPNAVVFFEVTSVN
ncbi:MAG: hypothetical protein IJS90_08160 [Clostridia bacterium]|nr:hypothetical protein [Clostridia bacterium]